jgi:hypothetical protein
LLQCCILLLRAYGYDEVSILATALDERRLVLRWVEKPTAVPAAMGRRTDRAAFSKMTEGSVREGM